MDPQQNLAAAVRRLGQLIITRPIGDDSAALLASQVDALADRYDGIDPLAKEVRFGGRNRVHDFVQTGTWPQPLPDGEEMDFDIASVVGGQYNPFSIGARYSRDGDEAVARVRVQRCYEGPPGRVHGGILCAIFDEVMGCVFAVTGTPSAFTGEIAVRFEGPAPTETDLEFRARELRTEGRKRFLMAQGASANGRFATATATFINLRPEHFDDSVL